MTLSEVTDITGKEGNLHVKVLQHPRFVDMDKCIACGTCAEKCPKKVEDDYNAGLMKRKAIYVPYSQTVPLKYAIDKDNCIYFQKGKCRACEKFCPAGAINFEDTEKELNLHVGSVVLAPGFKSFDPSNQDTYGYAALPNVVTSVEFERILSATGLEIDEEAVALSRRMGIELDPYHFVQSDAFHPVATSVPGIYACGAFTGPKDIPQSVMEASAAACAATEPLAVSRNTETRTVEIPPERDVTREKPRIGVFVCNCGINIGGVIRVPEVAQFAETLPNVVYVEENLFTCSQDTQDKMTAVIREQGLNRVVVGLYAQDA